MQLDSIPDKLREISIDHLFSTHTFQKCWHVWRDQISSLLGQNPTEANYFNLGDNLAEIFRSTGGSGRGQGELSAGGTAWESLVCWYINLCTAGSRVVAIKKMSLLPEPLRDSLTVNYGNFACNTESDIVVLIFPDLPEYSDPAVGLQIADNHRNHYVPIINNKLNPEMLKYLVTRDFNSYEIGVIQCKTNWNDNAQIPMLWDMIYSAGGFSGRNITIGRNGFSIQNLQKFTYSFVTVPSNQNTTYRSESVAVKRVTNLSGGNYWGRPTQQNVARSLKEIFTNNFSHGARSSLRSDLRNALPHMRTNEPLSYFNI